MLEYHEKIVVPVSHRGIEDGINHIINLTVDAGDS